MNDKHLKLTPALSTSLDQELQVTDAIKAEMSQLLKDLEQQVTGKTQGKIGGWRHHPRTWAKDNLN